MLKYGFLALMLIFVNSCEKDDFTGDSNMKPTNPTITVTGIPGGVVTLTETDTTFTFGVSMDPAQTVDVSLYIKQTGGDATADEDFKIENVNSRVFIPANTKTGTVSISILSDDEIEAEETLKIQIGDERTANASFTPVEVDFTIQNYTSSVLDVDMSWETDEADVIGLGLDPDEVVDLRMLVIDKAADTIVTIEDGSSFETYSSMHTLPDGDYLIAADIYSTIDAGDFSEEITLDITLELNQDGIKNHETMDFPGVMTNLFSCSSYRTYLATINKAGSTYTMTKSVSYLWAGSPSDLVGEWSGDDTEYDSRVVTYLENDTLKIDSLGFDWMEDFWGETVLVHKSAYLLFDNSKGGALIIPEQYYYTTEYGGDPYVYNVSGTASFNTCVSPAELTVIFDFYNVTDGYSVGEIGYPVGPATLELSGGGKKSALKSATYKVPIPESVKRQLLGK